MQKKNNKGVIALIIVLVLAAAALVIWQTNKLETQQGGKEITVNVDAVQMGVGGDDSWGARPHGDNMVGKGEYRLSFLVEGL